MGDLKEEIASATKEVVTGLSNEKKLGTILLVFFCVGFSSLVTYLSLKNSDQNSKYYSESLTNQLQVANQQVKQFNENISITNIALTQLKEQFSDFKIMQAEIQNSIKDHEKRLTKIEIKENIR